jgi:acyl-CoA dehydrogenase
MAGRAADRAVQIFGGRGYMRENVAERMYRELRVERIWRAPARFSASSWVDSC